MVIIQIVVEIRQWMREWKNEVEKGKEENREKEVGYALCLINVNTSLCVVTFRFIYIL
jgi:hypothetical protein